MVTCGDIEKLVDPVARCKFALEHCQLNSVLPYGEIVYCHMESSSPRLIFLVVSMILVFCAVGVAAFDILSPNLTFIAEVSGLPQTLMGVTVLAFGNGSVDVFGALVALNSNEGGMAFGEIMGGALFVVCVVIGSMAIVNPFAVEPMFFTRDSAMLGVSVFYTLMIISDGTIVLLEALFGLVLYALYATFAVKQQLGVLNITKNYDEEALIGDETDTHHGDGIQLVHCEPPMPALRSSLMSAIELNYKVFKHLHNIEVRLPSPLPPGSPIPVPFVPSPDTATPTHKGHRRRRSSAPDLAKCGLDDHDCMIPQIQIPPPQILVASANQFGSPGAISPTQTLIQEEPVEFRSLPNFSPVSHPHNHRSNKRSTLLSPIVIPPSSSGSDGRSQDGRSIFRSFECENIDMLMADHAPPFTLKDMLHRLMDESHTPSSARPSYRRSVTDALHHPNQETLDALYHGEGSVNHLGQGLQNIIEEQAKGLPSDFRRLLPFLNEWSELGAFQRLGECLMAPLTTMLAWSIPVPENSQCTHWLCVYAVGVPLSVPMLVAGWGFSPRVLLIQAVASSIGLTYWGWMRKPGPRPLITAAVGFIMALLWVMLLATELVAILTIMGAVIHVSSTLMGLTVFAIGDSLGDFVANVTVAKIGYSAMAIAACFGGPIFTLLVGISGASLVTMVRRRRLMLEIPVSRGLLISALSLIFVIIFLGFRIRQDRYMLTRKLGCQLIFIWFLVICSTTIFARD